MKESPSLIFDVDERGWEAIKRNSSKLVKLRTEHLGKLHNKSIERFVENLENWMQLKQISENHTFDETLKGLIVNFRMRYFDIW